MSVTRSPLSHPVGARIDDSNCDRIHSSLTAIRCFDNGYVGKQPVARKKVEESMDRSTGCRDITEILLKTVLNTIQSINLHASLTTLCGKAASGLERVLCGLLVKRTPGKHG